MHAPTFNAPAPVPRDSTMIIGALDDDLSLALIGAATIDFARHAPAKDWPAHREALQNYLANCARFGAAPVLAELAGTARALGMTPRLLLDTLATAGIEALRAAAVFRFHDPLKEHRVAEVVGAATRLRDVVKATPGAGIRAVAARLRGVRSRRRDLARAMGALGGSMVVVIPPAVPIVNDNAGQARR